MDILERTYMLITPGHLRVKLACTYTKDIILLKFIVERCYKRKAENEHQTRYSFPFYEATIYIGNQINWFN